MKPKPLVLEYYVTSTGKQPYVDWFKKLKDPVAKARIAVRLDRVKEGNLGVYKPVGDGVSELKIDYGPGYRVYCLKAGDKLIVLLCGGTKQGQQTDIQKAKAYAKDYLEK